MRVDVKAAVHKAKELFHSKKLPVTAIAAGVAGLMLILFSGSPRDNTRSKTENGAISYFSDNQSYRAELEQRMEKMLGCISGVGDVRVTVTLSASEEYVYAEESTQSGDRISNQFVIADKGGIVTRIESPRVTGAVVVCEGGGSAQVCEKVCKAVSVTLGIPTNRIYVVKMK